MAETIDGWVILKNSKNVIFLKTVFSFDSMSEDFLTRTKKVKNSRIPPVIVKKTLQELIQMFLQCFCANI